MSTTRRDVDGVLKDAMIDPVRTIRARIAEVIMEQTGIPDESSRGISSRI